MSEQPPDGAMWDPPANADPDTLRNALAAAREVVESLNTRNRVRESENGALKLELDSSKNLVTELNTKNTELINKNVELSTKTVELDARIREVVAENEVLKNRIGAGGGVVGGEPVRASIKLGDLVRDVRTSIERINTESLNTAATGKVAYVVDTVDVEARTGLDLKGEVKLLELDPSKIGPDTVSTVRFALRPATALRIEADDDTPATPAEVPPTR